MTREELREELIKIYIMPACKNTWNEKIYKQIEELFDKEPCEDCISRQAVDELSKNLVHTTRDKADFLCNFWEGLQKLPPVTPQEPGWISVSERLPIYATDVLTCSSGGFVEIQSLEDDYWENQHGDWSDIEEVTAWMPLPEPYKEESEVEE